MNVTRLVIRARAPPPRSMLRGFASAVPRIDDSSSTADASSSLYNPLKVNMKPSEVVAELNRHIVGQADAKRAVAIALRNRWRRQQLPDDLRPEVTPRNVLLVGPTGCGKTEVARRMAQIHDAPFLKVEATKFTEVGYHGRDVDQIIRDLKDVSMQLTKKVWTEKLREQARVQVEEKLLHLLTGPSSSSSSKDKADSSVRAHDSFRDMLQQGILDDQEIEIDVPLQNNSGDMGGGDALNPNIVAMSDLWQRVSSAGGGKKQATERKKVPISQARDILLQVELDQLLEAVDLKKEAITAVEESGIVFIDEIDKICSSRDSYRSKSTDASAEGVQRDLLPLIEGTTINTRHGNVKTDYILFIASGAFHSVKPSDLLPELQGRLPIQVELKGLTEDDLYRILTEPVANLVRQQIELLATEGVTLIVEDAAIREMARMAAKLNQTVENIGARRLHTVMERIMEELSFQAAESEGQTLTVDVALVQERMSSVTQKLDLSKFIL